MEIKASDGQVAYPRIVRHVLDHGNVRTPRGRTTLDAGFTTILLDTPEHALPIGVGRGLNVNIAAAEAIQLIGAFSDPDLLLKASPNFQQFLNGDGFHGAYGARIRMQVPNVIRKLIKDSQTRQAVITLWDAHLDNLTDMNDYPCTVALQFEVDELERLCMNVVMRSNDVWLGLPYDMFQFTQLQISVARALGLPNGWYRHTAMSMHIYSDDVEKTKSLHDPINFALTSLVPFGIGQDGQTFTEIMKRARRVASGKGNDDPTMSEGWYAERFASYMG